ncbi:hypothetical protein Taro_022733 [Colocasia esculenta]|uniref:Uncharacterized protein n=1 Tax=Colocasia esculenta TaxID=4460 RepID=A0A843VCA5_COLES|nr:hypothetical protein [Colocasia esculenta]
MIKINNNGNDEANKKKNLVKKVRIRAMVGMFRSDPSTIFYYFLTLSYFSIIHPKINWPMHYFKGHHLGLSLSTACMQLTRLALNFSFYLHLYILIIYFHIFLEITSITFIIYVFIMILIFPQNLPVIFLKKIVPTV